MANSSHDRQDALGSSYAWMYHWEMESPAYRALNVAERALLLHLRALYRPANGNRVSLSVQDAASKLGVSQRRIQHALRVLDARGWVEEVRVGARHPRTFLLLGAIPEQ
ncbi:MarR family transcriptional regulator [Stenotrophomonas maltophilia]|uniref:MarR family transcriptional regulator n=1 Tax=Stenotrophomonas maltophilia TaxID=40324 RepID=UPI0013DCA5C6|nr:MarR family transcriptional regulator [Stenotrophomonas maltophilia]